MAFAMSIFAQTPAKIYWKSGDDSIELGPATEGVDVKTSSKALEKPVATRSIYSAPTGTLSIVGKFSPKDIMSISDEVELEIKWYYYMSTRKSLIGTTTITLNKDNLDDDGFCSFEDTRNNVRSGWWEVSITNKTTSAKIVYAGNDGVYQIKLN